MYKSPNLNASLNLNQNGGFNTNPNASFNPNLNPNIDPNLNGDAGAGPNKKQVRFNNKVKMNTYSRRNPIRSVSPSRPQRNPREDKLDRLDVDDILSEIYSEENSDSDLRSQSRSNSKPIRKPLEIKPANDDLDDEEESWDSAFGMPLMEEYEKKKYIANLNKSNASYGKSLGEFAQHQLDDSTLIKTDTTIDRFKPPSTQKSRFGGKTIGDIYDEQTAGPIARPKRIKSRTADMTTYENESELNGGLIKGSNLLGFEAGGSSHQMADFGDQF